MSGSAKASDDPRHALTSLHASAVALDVGTLDLCFLAALHMRVARSGVTSFAEDALFDVLEQVQELVGGGGESEEAGAVALRPGRKRAANVVRRLREQKLLARVDAAGIVRKGEYALTRLASGIVEFYLEEDALTRESLDVLVTTLATCLEQVKGAVAELGSPEGDAEAWRARVTAPLEVTLVELANGIERRQRGFDLQQEVFQREIGALLASDWFGAVERCTTLLDTTSAVLRELNEILLRHGHRLAELLQEIQDACAEASATDAEAAARAGIDQLDRIAAWGAARQRAWSDYHDWVHRYLRDIVRLDPSRTLVHRLREQLAGRGGKAYALRVASAPPIQLLREDLVTPEARPVRRPKEARDKDLAHEEASDPDAALTEAIRGVIAGGSRGLADVTARVAEPDAPVDVRFRTAGRVAQIVPRVVNLTSERERAWVPSTEGILLEEWSLDALPAAEEERERE